ncbi:MAG: hypothetical protein OEW37_08770 [Rhodospirillaceae bacterium]|nr:hypothetical protein [Rhodospirillaceae bacterium]
MSIIYCAADTHPLPDYPATMLVQSVAARRRALPLNRYERRKAAALKRKQSRGGRV